MNIHLKIKDIRNQKNFGQSYMAEKMDISVVSYSSIERGVTELTVKRLYEISKILEVSINELLGEPIQNISDEKVKELEKRVLELEDRVKDKELIISTLQRDVKLIEKDLIEAIGMNVLSLAKKHNMVKVLVYKELRGKIEAEYDYKDFNEDDLKQEFIAKHEIIEESNYEKLYYLKDFNDLDFLLETVLLIRKKDIIEEKFELFKEVCNEINNFFHLPTKHYKILKNKDNDRN